MTTETTEATASDPSGGATTDLTLAWHQINWRHAERNVRRLQTRIAQTTQQGKWGKVKALQHLLTHSFSGKALAVRRVTENTGKRTPGVDGQSWKTPEQKATAIHALRQRGYHPQPSRRVYIPKSNGKQRPLGILMQRFPKVKTAEGALVNFVRYADDFLVTGRTKDLLEQEVKPLIEEFLRERGLHLSPEKTLITHIKDGFDFLGQNVRKYQTGKRHKLLITPSKKNVKAFLEKIRAIVKANKALSAGKLIEKLNPMIRGWANYHRHIVGNKAFSSVDAMIYQAIRRWMNRRHRGKSEAWKTKKYFTTIQGDHWVFFGTVEQHPRYLIRATNVPIVRHVKIQGEANPYDPAWESYFERRLDVHMAATLKGKHWLLTLWKEQGGLCPICQQKITKITGWHSHHILWRSKGGADTAENRVLLHPTCHQQVHSQGTPVTKPRPLDNRRR